MLLPSMEKKNGDIKKYVSISSGHVLDDAGLTDFLVNS